MTKNTKTTTTIKTTEKALIRAHAAVERSRVSLAAAREARANAATPAEARRAAGRVERHRTKLAEAMEARRAAMQAFRVAGGRVVDMQRICGFSSSGATLFALNGGKTPPSA